MEDVSKTIGMLVMGDSISELSVQQIMTIMYSLLIIQSDRTIVATNSPSGKHPFAHSAGGRKVTSTSVAWPSCSGVTSFD
jgi:hypothetical protein